MNSEKSAVRRRGGYAMMFLAALTCPCHLPVLALLLSGTAAEAFLTEHMGVALTVLGALFLLSLSAAMWLLRNDAARGGSNL